MLLSKDIIDELELQTEVMHQKACNSQQSSNEEVARALVLVQVSGDIFVL